MSTGKLIAFEGEEGAGKTSRMRTLYEYLVDRGHKVISTFEPGGTEVGLKLRTVVLGYDMDKMTELFIMLADRAQHITEYILPKLEEGYIILCDRYFYSTFAYQHYGRGIAMDQVWTLNDIACQGVDPDVVVYLDVDPIIGLERRGREDTNRLDVESLEFHQRVHAGYKTMFDISGVNLPWYTRVPQIVIIDTNTTKEEEIDAFLTEYISSFLA